MQKDKSRFRSLAESIFSPKAPNVQAKMDERQKKMKKLKSTGGMFDVIYKGRKAREDAMKEGGY